MTNAVSYVRGIIPDVENREINDFYPTPPEGTEALLNVESFTGSVWEPACGDGAMSKVISDHGHVVCSSDLINRGYGRWGVDFLADPPVYKTANIITNPPFKHAQEFAERALDLTTGKVAMLCRLAWLESVKRKPMFQSTPLSKVWVFSKRLHMARGGGETKGGMIAFAWFVWDHSYGGEPRIGWL